MLEMLGTIASGGAVGIVGSVINKGFSLVDRYQGVKLQQLKWQHDLTLLEMKQRFLHHKLQKEEAIANLNTTANLRSESYQHDTAIGQGSLWVINIIRLVRPILTLGLVTLTACIWYHLGNKSAALSQTIIETILFCTTAALTWWFGDRAK